MKELISCTCRKCGGDLRIDDNKRYRCNYCGTQYKIELDADVNQMKNVIKDVLDSAQEEKIAKLHRELYTQLKKQYTNSEEILELCSKIRDIKEDDLYASFFTLANERNCNYREIGAFIADIDAQRNVEMLDEIIEFLIKSPKVLSGVLGETLDLIQRGYGDSSDEGNKFRDRVIHKAKEIDKGIFDCNLSRDAFIAYSAKDQAKAMALVNYLENKQKISCYISSRNLQHGSGAKTNYGSELATAIKNCRVIVFVSSSNSRNNSCDALNREISFVKQQDMDNACQVGRGNLSYDKIDLCYKKPRVEYLIEDYSEDAEDIAEAKVKEFFEGYEWATKPLDVAHRIVEAKENPYQMVSKPTEMEENAELKKLRDELERIKLEQLIESTKANAKKQKLEEKQKKKEALLRDKEQRDNQFSIKPAMRSEDRKAKIYKNISVVLSVLFIVLAVCTVVCVLAGARGFSIAAMIIGAVVCVLAIICVVTDYLIHTEVDWCIRVVCGIVAACFALIGWYQCVNCYGFSDRQIKNYTLVRSYINEQTVEVPEEIRVIGSYAFAGMFGQRGQLIQSVHLPESIEYISEHAFCNCESLREVYINVGVLYIGDSAFSGTAVRKIYFAGTQEQWDAIEKEDGGFLVDKWDQGIENYEIICLGEEY